MTLILTACGRPDRFDVEIERVRALLPDLRHLRKHGPPPGGMTAEAPLLDDRCPAARTAPCLVGRPRGHLHVSCQRRAGMSPRCVLFPDLRSACTESGTRRLLASATERFDA